MKLMKEEIWQINDREGKKREKVMELDEWKEL